MTRTCALPAVWVGLAVLIGSVSGYAQSEAARERLTVAEALPAGTRTYAAGAWGLVEVSVTNRSEMPAKVLSSLFFPGDPNQQYGRELWMPPRSRRFAWYPVYVPPDIPEGAGFLEFKALVLDRTDEKERLLQSPTGEMLRDGLLPIDRDGGITGWIGEDDPPPDESPPPNVGDMIVAARVGTGLTRKVVALRGHALPADADSLQGIEHLVISGDRPLYDAAGLEAIAEWVRRGGRLWIVLTDVPPSLVERLLGEDCRIQTVDRVGLTEVRIEASRASDGSDPAPREFEKPVEMVRVLAEGVEVTHTVDGWPAAFWQKLGRGEVLFTALAPAGWVRPSRPGDRRPATPLGDAEWLPHDPLLRSAERLTGRPEGRLPSVDDWEPLLEEQIGYRVVGRGTVAGVLGLSCAALAVAAVWFGRGGRLERLGWAAPLASLASAGALVAVGVQNTGSVASSVAEGELIETSPGTSVARVSGLAMLFNREQGEVELGGRGSVLFPDMTGFTGETRRLVWTDWDRWHWENLALPRGVRVAPFQRSIKLESPVFASGEFGPGGFTGQISGPMRDGSDLVLATPPGGALAPEQTTDGRFSAGQGEVLAPGEFVSESLLSDVQRRRQDLYRRLLGAGRGSAFRDRPTLFAWVTPPDLGFVYPEGSEKVGEALAAIPLEVRRTRPGTRVTIPSPFIDPQPAPGVTGSPPSPLFDRRSGEPVEHADSIEAWVRFQLPKEVVPLDLDRAKLSLTVSGAARSLEVLCRPAGAVESLRKWENPAGALEIDIERADALALDDRGGLLLGIRVGGEPRDFRTRKTQSYWRVESMRLEATGRTREP